MNDTIVLKFGGSSVADNERLKVVEDKIINMYNKNNNIVVILDLYKRQGTNNEFGFDYLRDNMVIYKNQLVQRGLHYAIVDEIDSILIDEARTPLIISGRANESSDLYKKADNFVRRLKPKVIVEEDVKDFDQAEDNEKYDRCV